MCENDSSVERVEKGQPPISDEKRKELQREAEQINAPQRTKKVLGVGKEKEE